MTKTYNDVEAVTRLLEEVTNVFNGTPRATRAVVIIAVFHFFTRVEGEGLGIGSSDRPGTVGAQSSS